VESLRQHFCRRLTSVRTSCCPDSVRVCPRVLQSRWPEMFALSSAAASASPRQVAIGGCLITLRCHQHESQAVFRPRQVSRRPALTSEWKARTHSMRWRKLQLPVRETIQR
jgi:hypothetical protein